MNRRREEISSSEEIAQEWEEKAGRYSRDLEDNVSMTRKEGLKERENLKDQGMDREKEMLQEAYSSVEAKLAETRREIEERIAQVSQSLKGELDDFSQELAEKVLGRAI